MTPDGAAAEDAGQRDRARSFRGREHVSLGHDDHAPDEHLTPSCGKASADAIVTELQFGVLQQIIGEAGVVIHALGFSSRLVAADLIALRTFGHTLASRVVVR
jgi:hypothetical protein